MNENDTNEQYQSQSKVKNVPDDAGLVHVDGFVRIFDPNTNHILVEVRE